MKKLALLLLLVIALVGCKKKEEAPAPAPAPAAAPAEPQKPMSSSSQGVPAAPAAPVAPVEKPKAKPPKEAYSKEKYPEFKPWPPPKASAFYDVPRDLLLAGITKPTLGAVTQRIKQALDQAGYNEKGFLKIPGGYLLITRIENINDDGTPKTGPDRWDINNLPSCKSFSEYISILKHGKVGLHRFIMLAITDKYFYQDTAKDLAEKDAAKYLRKVANDIPLNEKQKNYNENYFCKVLIYEYRKTSQAAEPELTDPSKHDGKEHMQKSGIYAKL